MPQQFMQNMVLGGAIVVELVGLVVFYLFLKNYRLGMASKSWLPTTGKIVSSEVINASEGYRYNISYSYTVVGKEYISNALHTMDIRGFHTNLGLSAAKAKVTKYPVDSIVQVYYKPDDPQTAILEKGVPKSSIILLVVALMFLLGGIFFGWVGLFVVPTL